MSRRDAPAAVRWTVYVGIAIVFAIACGFLSNWQFSRNAGRAQQLALISQNYHAAPVPLDTVIPPGGTLAADDEWQPVRLTGRYLTDEQLLARNRVHGGSSSYEILVPFQLDDGRVLLVDRGWEPPGEKQPDPDHIPAAPSGEVTVVVRVRPGEDLPPSGRSAPADQVPSIHLQTVAGMLDPASGRALELSAYGIMTSESPAPSDTPLALEDPSDDPGPYLSYAVQWILFAVMGFAFIGYVIRTERARRREELQERAEAAARGEVFDEEAQAAASLARRSRSARRRDRDADDEDALLDSASR